MSASTALRAADCHAHIFCPDLPFASEASYLPDVSQRGTAKGFLAAMGAHGMTHGLLVAAQPYGTNNRCMIEGIAAAKGRLKGIALVAPTISEADLGVLADSGVIGIRFSLFRNGIAELTDPHAQRLLARIKDLGWFLQIHCQHDQLAEAMPLFRRDGPRLLIDHFGRPDIAKGISQPGFQALLDLGRQGRAVVKLSAPFRCSLDGPPYEDVDPFIAAAVDAFTLDHCVWGSDWPFVGVQERVDYGPQVEALNRWLPDSADRHRILWENPARLFGLT